MAICVLAFARHEPAIPQIAKMLHDRKRNIDKTARTGLIQYGRESLPTLQRLLTRSRPDRRPKLLEVIETIRQSE